MKKQHVMFATLLSLVYFVAAFVTIADYGVSWDETIHFRRGQAYLRYFLTGQSDYESFLGRRSYYQNDHHNGDWFLKRDVGHPPLNGELAALSNYIFYQKLGMMGDIESHHLFGLLITTGLVFVVTYWSVIEIGFVGGSVAGLSLMLYPLFWAESKFNVKDPVEASLFSFSLIAFYYLWKTKKRSWVVWFLILWGLAMAVKFNAVFIFVVIGIWSVVYFYKVLARKRFYLNILKNYGIGIIVGFGLAGLIFFGSWPYLWDNPSRLIQIINYYRNVGIGNVYQPDVYYFWGFNLYPLVWIFFTTPPLVLLLFFMGLIACFKGSSKPVWGLWGIWFGVSLLRVMVPGSSIYGGSRQIMEFIPAMALVAGVGGEWFTQKFRNKAWVKMAVMGAFLWPVMVLYQLHPNENVYFNFLAGGLRGASEVEIPAWGNSFGNAYKQGIEWLNENAEEGARVALIQGTPSNAPAFLFRGDLEYLVNNDVNNRETYFSGIGREGEYLMELTHGGAKSDFYFAWEYVEEFLEPVYEVEVEGVPILKIWKNDLKNMRDEYRTMSEKTIQIDNFSKEGNVVWFDLEKTEKLTGLKVAFLETEGCYPLMASYVEHSLDGENWLRERDWIPHYQIHRKLNATDGEINYFLAGKDARYLRLILDNADSCALNIIKSSAGVLE